MTPRSDIPSFLADECVYQETIDFLRSRGFDVVRVQDLGLGGASDREVFTKAQELNLVLLTNDLGFSDIRSYPPSGHRGIIVLRLRDYRSVADVHAVLGDLLASEERFAGALFIVDRHKWRKRTGL